jgi:hypothetical protein
MSSQRWICVATTVALLAAGNAANAQCEWNWADGFQLGGHGLDGPAYALLTFDDGSGPALYTGGAFRSAGEVDADRVARWDGQDWSALGGGLGDEVWALAAFDDGRGLALYAGGKFKAADGQSAYRVAKWNGEAWSPVGGGIEHGLVHTLAVFDDGTGPALYAGVSYFAASPTSATGVMKWDGTTWSQVGGGLNGAARALAVFDDGRGPALYAGGWFVTASGTAVNHVAKWDGVAWSPLGAGLDQAVDALAVFDDGRGPALYAAGKFTAAGATTVNGIARWDGARWSALAGGVRGIDARVYALTGYDDSGGPALYAAGTFATAGGAAANNIARWDGTSWWPLGTGVDSAVHALAVFDNGSGPVLCAVGAFSTAGGADARYAASWDGAAWAPMVSPRGNGVGSEVRALAIYDDGSGAALYVGGAFTLAGSIRANRVAKWG